jgi:NAD(P)-dependent dehydrogenase (short-subunit alcohol dehydrogenase family)
MKTDLSGKTAIVTGGGKGYGEGIAAALAAKGVNVWITGRDAGALQRAAVKLGAHAVQADAALAGDWDRVFSAVLGETGRLDILVNNAGGGMRIAHVTDTTDQEIEQSIAVNLTGAIFGCRRAAQVMKRQRSGTIINVSSVCQQQAWPGWSVYSAAKAGLAQFSTGLYTELREHGVRVTTLIPSWGNTGFLDAADLTPFSTDIAEQCIQPAELGDLVVTICELPPHLEIQDLTVWPLVQKVEPL